jgi:hypothetical protein
MRLYVIVGAAVTAALLLAGCGAPGALPGAQYQAAPSFLAPAGGPTNLIKNGCFTGLSGWTEVKGTKMDTSNPKSGSVSVTSGGYGTCKHAIFAGTTKPPAPNGYWGVSQKVKVPSTGGTLTWWYKGANDNEMLQYGQQTVTINGEEYVGKTKTPTCYVKLATTTKWKAGRCNLKSYKGKTITVFFGVYDNGYDKTAVDWYVSDISLT